jgi:hypothetical protein
MPLHKKNIKKIVIDPSSFTNPPSLSFPKKRMRPRMQIDGIASLKQAGLIFSVHHDSNILLLLIFIYSPAHFFQEYFNLDPECFFLFFFSPSLAPGHLEILTQLAITVTDSKNVFLLKIY